MSLCAFGIADETCVSKAVVNMKRPASALAALAAFLVLLPVAWAMHFACKPRCWRALLALCCWLPAEWSHNAFIYALHCQGRLEDMLIRGLRAAL